MIQSIDGNMEAVSLGSLYEGSLDDCRCPFEICLSTLCDDYTGSLGSRSSCASTLSDPKCRFGFWALGFKVWGFRA